MRLFNISTKSHPFFLQSLIKISPSYDCLKIKHNPCQGTYTQLNKTYKKIWYPISHFKHTKPSLSKYGRRLWWTENWIISSIIRDSFAGSISHCGLANTCWLSVVVEFELICFTLKCVCVCVRSGAGGRQLLGKAVHFLAGLLWGSMHAVSQLGPAALTQATWELVFVV